MIYRSKKDGWLVALAAAVVLLPFAQAVYAFAGGNAQTAWPLLFAGLGIALILLLTCPVHYELTPSALKVRRGVVFRKQIPLAAIQEVRPTRNPLSAPAWSLDRLHVSYGAGNGESFVLISPEGKSEFMLELVARGL